MVKDSTIENGIFGDEFLEKGFVVLKECIEIELLDQIKKIISDALSRRLNKTVDYREGFLEAIKYEKQFQVQEELIKELNYFGFLQKILNQKIILDKLIYLLGPDLCFEEDSGFPINVTEVTNDFYVKKWHQEFWSGAGIHTVNLWFPINIEEGMGGLELIPGSHQWGHIPHQNREPLSIPDCAEFVTPNINVGDAVMFHSLTLHRTVVNKHKFPRFALSLMIKNFYHTDTGIPEFKVWRPLHFSPLARVHKILGNPAFSPFRTLGTTREEGLFDHVTK